MSKLYEHLLVMLLWVYFHTGQAWKICLATVKYACPPCMKSMPAHRGQAYFQACPVWKYTQSNITSILFTWVHYTITANLWTLFSCNSLLKFLHLLFHFSHHPIKLHCTSIGTLLSYFTLSIMLNNQWVNTHHILYQFLSVLKISIRFPHSLFM